MCLLLSGEIAKFVVHLCKICIAALSVKESVPMSPNRI